MFKHNETPDMLCKNYMRLSSCCFEFSNAIEMWYVSLVNNDSFQFFFVHWNKIHLTVNMLLFFVFQFPNSMEKFFFDRLLTRVFCLEKSKKKQKKNLQSKT